MPHIDFDWKQCNERLANRSPREKFYETMVAATNELVADLQNENQMLKNQLDCEKEKMNI